MEINERICRLRPVEEAPPGAQEKKRPKRSRVIKIFECVEESRSSMMDVEHEHNHIGAAFGLRDRIVNQELLLENEYLAAANRF